jgi:hypothetical protein
VTASCGGDDDSNAESERFECIQAAQAEASADAVIGFYERGELGDAGEVQAQIEAIPTPGFDAESFLTGEGRMLAWGEMNDRQRATFDAWKRTHAVQNVVEEQEQRAVRLAREQARASCPDA